MQPVTCRPATASDAPAVAAIWQAGWPDGHLGHVPDELLEVRTPQSFRDRSAERVSDTTVALVEDVVAGFTMVVGDEVEQVYVSQQYRGTGVAAALLTEAERRVAASGQPRAWLAVVAGSMRARRFYERSGWVDEGPFDYLAVGPAGLITVPCHRYARSVF